MDNILCPLYGQLIDVLLIWLHTMPLPTLNYMSTTTKPYADVRFHMLWSQVSSAWQPSPYQGMWTLINKILPLALFEPAAHCLSFLVAPIQRKFVSSVAGREMSCSAISMLIPFLSFTTTPESCFLAATTALCDVIILNFPPLPPWSLHSSLFFLALPVQSYWLCRRGGRNHITLLKFCITTTVCNVNGRAITMNMTRS